MGKSPSPGPQRATTLATVAQRVGVHTSTVSRALSSDPRVRGTVAPETAAQIREVAAFLDYRPNIAGSALRTGRSRLLGVLVPRLTDMVLATIYEGIDRAAAEAGYFTFVSNTEDDPQLQRERTDMTLDRGVDGLLLGDVRNDTDRCEELRARDVPVVLFHRTLPGFVSASIDDVRGGQVAAEHLCAQGRRTIAVIAGPRYASTGRARSDGFVRACAEWEVEVEPRRVIHAGFGVEAGRSAAERLLRMRPRPDAIFAVNDFSAIGAMGAIRDAGLRPGSDIAVVGYNDVSLAADLPIPLTSVRTPLRELGETAVRLMLDVLGGATPDSVELEPSLQVRESSLTG